MNSLEPVGQLLLVHGRDPFTDDGGGPTYVKAWARAAREVGLDPVFFSIKPRSWGTQVQQTPLGTIYLVGSPLGSSPWTSAPLHGPLLRRAIVRHIRESPDTYVIHGFSGWANFSPRMQKKLRRLGSNVELVTTVWAAIGHEARAKLASEIVQNSARKRVSMKAAVHWNRWVTRRVMTRACEASRYVLLNYDSVAEQVGDECGVNLNIRKIGYLSETAFDDQVINPATRIPDAQPPSDIAGIADLGVPMVLAMSRHDGRKGLDVLIRSLAVLQERGVEFVACIGGGGSLLAGHRDLVTSLGLNTRVILTGRVPQVLPYLKAADVFVLPSIEEGSGSVSVLEALQAGIAVVSTDVDGMTEDLTDSIDALLVAPSDEIALADAIQRLVEDPALRQQIALAGRDLFERKFSREQVLAEVSQLYQDLGILQHS